MRLDVASVRTFPTGISERKDFFKSPEESEVAYSLPIMVHFYSKRKAPATRNLERSEFFGICNTSPSLTPRHDPHEALSHSIPKSKQADENNE